MGGKQDHHFIPQFHLARWGDESGLVRQWSRVGPHRKLVSKLIAPAGTAYVPDLYALANMEDERKHAVERLIFGAIDTRAADILARLDAPGRANLTAQDRYWWALYLHAAILRVPETLQFIKSEAEPLFRASLGDESDPMFLATKGDRPERTLAEWVEKHQPGRLENSGMETFVNLLHGKDIIARIASLEWGVKDLSSARGTLVLCDRPLRIVKPLLEPGCLISMALSPTRIFFASNHRFILDGVCGHPSDRIVEASNQTAAAEAIKHVYGEADRPFLEAHFTAPGVPPQRVP